MEPQARYRGAMVGLAAGDALGTTVEFCLPGSFEPLTDMIGGGIFDLEPGQWTDDTSMALCLGVSLIQCKGFDVNDQMRRYIRWRDDGYASCVGICFDIGNTVATALEDYLKHGDPYAGRTEDRFGGNGSLMRLAPVPLAYAHDPPQAISLSGEMSRTTHAASEPVDACRYYGGLIVASLSGIDKQELLGERYCPVAGQWKRADLSPRIDEVAAGSFKHRQPPEITGSGYVVKSLEAALWAFWHTETFKEGALWAVNLGNDADTTGAIYGQLAGAYYGLDAIPVDWRDKVANFDEIIKCADLLLELSKSLR